MASPAELLAPFVDKRILVTGGSGYLALGLVRALSGVQSSVVRLSRSGGTPAGVVRQTVGRVDDVIGDVRDPDTWARALPGVDFVFHLAAQTSVPRASQDPPSDLEVNARSMLHLLETCRRHGYQPAILFAGTVTEAGIPTTLPVDETHPDAPATIYDLHKLVAESYLKHYAAQGVVRGATLRLSNVYGPGPESGSADRGVLNRMVAKALNREPLTVFGAGEYVRDYVYVEDVTAAFLAAGAHIERASGRSFVIGTGTGHTVSQALNLVADRVALKTGCRVPVTHVDPPQPLHPIERRNFVADTTRFREATGWAPRVSLVEGIDRTVAYLAAAAAPRRSGDGTWSGT